MTLLLEVLDSEIQTLDLAGSNGLDTLLDESSMVLSELKELEAELEDEISMERVSATDCSGPRTPEAANPGPFTADFTHKIEERTHDWYKRSIDGLKSYNSQITKFQRNITGSQVFNVDLDDAYTFPLMLNSLPTKEQELTESPAITDSFSGVYSEEEAASNDFEMSPHEIITAKLVNRHFLMRSIVLHLLKTGHAPLVRDMVDDFGVSGEIDPETLQQFLTLGDIVDDIRQRHDLAKALDWLVARNAIGDTRFETTSFKFHMLQFVLLLSGKTGTSSDKDASGSCGNINLALGAYTYAKTHFPRFIKDHVEDISPIISLLLLKTTSDDASMGNLEFFKAKIHLAFLHSCETRKRHSKETLFVAEILGNFDQIHGMHAFFNNLATEFVQEYCKSMGLSTESSLFQTILAGHVNLPNFYKYSQLQQKLRRQSVVESPKLAVSAQDLPFSLSLKNQFLFNFHPIFICPISKEQLVPLISKKRVADTEAPDRKRKQIFVSPNEVLVSPSNPVVVFEFCRHLALKESVTHLTKSGDSFKCHYCYKKHKITDISDAYFIDL